jgi:hypothetical protein
MARPDRSRWILAALLGVPITAGAQTTGTPAFMAPPPPQFVSSIGLFGTNGNRGRGAGLEAEYRFVPRSRRFDFGFRAGIGADTLGHGTAKLVGVDGRYSFFHESPEFPVDAALTAGIGFRLRPEADLALIPIGATFGRRLTPPSGAVLVTTYMHPKVFFASESSKRSVGFNMGVGVNLLFTRGYEFRIGGSVGDYGGFGIGFILFRPFPPEAPEVSGAP